MSNNKSNSGSNTNASVNNAPWYAYATKESIQNQQSNTNNSSNNNNYSKTTNTNQQSNNNTNNIPWYARATKESLTKNQINAINKSSGNTLSSNDNYSNSLLGKLTSVINITGNSKSVGKKANKLDTKYSSKKYDDTIIGRARANYRLGDISNTAMLAWNNYLNDPTEENYNTAVKLSTLEEKFRENNAYTLDEYKANGEKYGAVGNAVLGDYANYLPQLFGQLKISAPLMGAVIGKDVLLGAGIGELTTPVPGIDGALGGAVGLISGVAKSAAIPGTVGSGVYSYQTMRGGSFKNLIDLGTDEFVASEASEDEAILSSLIESGDTLLSILQFAGVGKALGKAKTLIENSPAVVGWLSESAGEYGEEALQELISAANEARIQDGLGTGGITELLSYIANSGIWDDEHLSRYHEAGMGGFKIGLIGGGLSYGSNIAYAKTINNAQVKAMQSDPSKLKNENLTISDLERIKYTAQQKKSETMQEFIDEVDKEIARRQSELGETTSENNDNISDGDEPFYFEGLSDEEKEKYHKQEQEARDRKAQENSRLQYEKARKDFEELRAQANGEKIQEINNIFDPQYNGIDKDYLRFMDKEIKDYNASIDNGTQDEYNANRESANEIVDSTMKNEREQNIYESKIYNPSTKTGQGSNSTTKPRRPSLRADEINNRKLDDLDGSQRETSRAKSVNSKLEDGEKKRLYVPGWQALEERLKEKGSSLTKTADNNKQGSIEHLAKIAYKLLTGKDDYDVKANVSAEEVIKRVVRDVISEKAIEQNTIEDLVNLAKNNESSEIKKRVDEALKRELEFDDDADLSLFYLKFANSLSYSSIYSSIYTNNDLFEGLDENQKKNVIKDLIANEILIKAFHQDSYELLSNFLMSEYGFSSTDAAESASFINSHIIQGLYQDEVIPIQDIDAIHEVYDIVNNNDFTILENTDEEINNKFKAESEKRKHKNKRVEPIKTSKQNKIVNLVNGVTTIGDADLIKYGETQYIEETNDNVDYDNPTTKTRIIHRGSGDEYLVVNTENNTIIGRTEDLGQAKSFANQNNEYFYMARFRYGDKMFVFNKDGMLDVDKAFGDKKNLVMKGKSEGADLLNIITTRYGSAMATTNVFEVSLDKRNFNKKTKIGSVSEATDNMRTLLKGVTMNNGKEYVFAGQTSSDVKKGIVIMMEKERFKEMKKRMYGNIDPEKIKSFNPNKYIVNAGTIWTPSNNDTGVKLGDAIVLKDVYSLIRAINRKFMVTDKASDSAYLKNIGYKGDTSKLEAGKLIDIMSDMVTKITDGTGFIMSDKKTAFQFRSIGGFKGLLTPFDFVSYLKDNMILNADKEFVWVNDDGEIAGGIRFIDEKTGIEMLDKWNNWIPIEGKKAILFDSTIKFGNEYTSTEDFYNKVGKEDIRSVPYENVYGASVKLDEEDEYIRRGLAQALRGQKFTDEEVREIMAENVDGIVANILKNPNLSLKLLGASEYSTESPGLGNIIGGLANLVGSRFVDTSFGKYLVKQKIVKILENTKGGQLLFDKKKANYQWIAPDMIGLFDLMTSIEVQREENQDTAAIGKKLESVKNVKNDKGVTYKGYKGLAKGEISNANLANEENTAIIRYPSMESADVQARNNINNEIRQELIKKYKIDKNITYQSVQDPLGYYLDNDFDGDTVVAIQGALADILAKKQKEMEKKGKNKFTEFVHGKAEEVNTGAWFSKSGNKIYANANKEGDGAYSLVKAIENSLSAESIGKFDRAIDKLDAFSDKEIKKYLDSLPSTHEFYGWNVDDVREILQARFAVAYKFNVDYAKTGWYPEDFKNVVNKSINMLVEIANANGYSVTNVNDLKPSIYEHAKNVGKREEISSSYDENGNVIEGKHIQTEGEDLLSKINRVAKGFLPETKYGEYVPNNGVAESVDDFIRRVMYMYEVEEKEANNNAFSFSDLAYIPNENYQKIYGVSLTQDQRVKLGLYDPLVDDANDVVTVSDALNLIYQKIMSYKTGLTDEKESIKKKQEYIFRIEKLLGLSPKQFQSLMMNALSRKEDRTNWQLFLNLNERKFDKSIKGQTTEELNKRAVDMLNNQKIIKDMSKSLTRKINQISSLITELNSAIEKNIMHYNEVKLNSGNTKELLVYKENIDALNLLSEHVDTLKNGYGGNFISTLNKIASDLDSIQTLGETLENNEMVATDKEIYDRFIGFTNEMLDIVESMENAQNELYRWKNFSTSEKGRQEFYGFRKNDDTGITDMDVDEIVNKLSHIFDDEYFKLSNTQPNIYNPDLSETSKTETENTIGTAKKEPISAQEYITNMAKKRGLSYETFMELGESGSELNQSLDDVSSVKGFQASTQGNKFVQALKDWRENPDKLTDVISSYAGLRGQENKSHPMYDSKIEKDLETLNTYRRDYLNNLTDKTYNKYKNKASEVASELSHRAKKVADSIAANEELKSNKETVKSPASLFGKLRLKLRRFQNSPEVMAASESNFSGKGIGYKDKKKIFDANRTRVLSGTYAIELLKQLATGKQNIKDFYGIVSGKTMSNVDIGGTQVSLSEVLKLKLINETLKASGKSLDGKELYLMRNGKPVKVTISDAETLMSKIESEIGNNKVATEFLNTCVDIYDYFDRGFELDGKERNIKTVYKELWGSDVRAYEKGKYTDIRYVGEDGKSINSPSTKHSIKSFRTTSAEYNFDEDIINSSEMGNKYILVNGLGEDIYSYIDNASKYIAYAELADELSMRNAQYPGVDSISDIYDKAYADTGLGEWWTNYINTIDSFGESQDTFNKTLNNILALQQGGFITSSIGTIFKQKANHWSALGYLDFDSLVKGRLLWKRYSEEGNNNLYMKARLGKGSTEVNAEYKTDSDFIKAIQNNPVTNFLKNKLSKSDYEEEMQHYAACRYQIMKDNPNLTEDEIVKKTDELFGNVVMHCSPMFYKEMRSEYARTNNATLRVLGMFRTIIDQYENNEYLAKMEMQSAINSSMYDEKAKQYKRVRNGNRLSALSLACISTAFNLVMRTNKFKTDDDDDGEYEFDVGKIAESLFVNYVGGKASQTWLLGEGAELGLSLFGKLADIDFGEYYSPTTSAFDQITKTVTALTRAVSSPSAKNVKNLINAISLNFGVSTNSAYEIANAVTMKTLGLLGENDKNYSDMIEYFEANNPSKNNSMRKNAEIMINSIVSGNTEKTNKAYSLLKGSDGNYEDSIKDKLKDMYLNRDITIEKAHEIANEYLYQEKSEKKRSELVEKLIRSWEIEEYTKASYEDLDDAYLDGDISIDDYINSRIYYGIDEETVYEDAQRLEFISENPDYDNVTNTFVNNYNEYYSQWNISVKDAYDFYDAYEHNTPSDKDEYGHTVSNSKMYKVIEWLENNKTLTNEQKRALFLSKYSKSNLKYCSFK